MSQFYDQFGNICHSKVTQFASEIGHRTTMLMAELFEDGLTIVEARAIGSYLESQINSSLLIELMRQQCKLLRPKQEESNEVPS